MTGCCAFGAVLLSFALSYLTRELSDGTPFVDDTAIQLRRLGVVLILASLVFRYGAELAQDKEMN